MKKKFYSTMFYNRKLLFPAVFVFFMFSSVQSAHAGVWGADVAITIWKQAAEQVAITLRDTLVGVAKQAIAQIMNSQISVLVGGGGGNGPMFITNWQSFLVNDPQKQTNSFMNDFFTMTTSGRNSSSNYRPAPSGCESNGYRGTIIQGGCVINSSDASTRVGVLNNEQQTLFTQEGIIATANAADYVINRNAPEYCGKSTTYTCAQAATSCASLTPSMTEDTACQAFCGTGQKYCSYKSTKPTSLADKNYYKYQTDAAKAAINPAPCKMDLLDYVSSPSQIFNGGSWRGLNAFFSNPCNNTMAYTEVVAKPAYNASLAQEQRKAETQAIAYQGFKAAVGSDGVTVKTPGITVGQLVDKVQGFSFDSIASAQGVSAIVQSVATTVISAVVTKGLNAATAAVQGGINSATGEISSATGGAINLNIQASSLANTDWNNSGSGQSSEFNNGVNNFNSDAQSGLTNNNQTWGNMNFSGAHTNSANASSQSSYSSLGSNNFQSTQNTGSLGSSPNSFVPNTSWTGVQTTQSNDPLWNGDK